MNGHKNPNDSHNYHDENHDEIEFNQGNSQRSTRSNDTQHQNNAPSPKKQNKKQQKTTTPPPPKKKTKQKKNNNNNKTVL